MEYTVKQLADLAGVTPRTLRWYDARGLLKPAAATPAGYRLYGPAELDRLQQILFYRELGLGLEQIKAVLDASDFDRQGALQSHLSQLELRRERLDALILTVRKAIDETKGGPKVSDKEKFEAFKRRTVAENEAKYGAELRAAYGGEAVDGANAKLERMTPEDYDGWQALGRELAEALSAAVRAGERPDGPEGARIAQLHKRWLSGVWKRYEPNAHRGVVELYVSDPRFTAYYDGETPGCAAFLRDAVRSHIGRA